MRRTFGKLLPLALAAPFLLAGCGGAGDETSAPPPPAGPATGAPAAGNIAASDAAPKEGSPPRKVVTPETVIDSKGLSKVVKEEEKGGEAAASPSPTDYLWQLAKDELIQDEPLTPKLPRPLPALTLNVYVPAANPLTKGKVELGKQLYFDPRVSLDGTVSCATCHNPEKGWTDGAPVSTGIDGLKGDRSAPTVLNTAYGKTMFWDGRAPSLEAQAQGPVQNPIEMGKQSYKQIIERLRTISGYREQFQKVFGTDVTLDGMAKAIAAFERVTAVSGNSKYDKYTAGDLKALDDSEKRGMVLFGLRASPDDDFKTDAVLKKAMCTSCHVGFNFTDEQFHNLGIGWDPAQKSFKDKGRWAVTPIGARNNAEIGAFKTPTVRDAARTGPYMHDGSLKTLEEVVEHYNKGGNPNPFLDNDLKKPLNLTDQEKKDVVAFMKALTGEEIAVELPKLPAGPDGKTPDPRSALKAPAPKTAFHPSTVR
ncbi:MAG: cytochrome c peroxidase [Isosphaeraceae bacterium]|nr:cytochrome c peroxidase [Isosphaeraceae bacterium]